MSWLFGKKPVGKWVEREEYGNYGQGRFGTGQYDWVGPEPKGGRPPNPATTPEGMAVLQKIAATEAARYQSTSANLARSQKERREKDEEVEVCKKACDEAIAALKAKRASATSKTRKRNRKQRKTRSRTRR